MIEITEPDPSLHRLTRACFLVGHRLSQSLPVADSPEDMARDIDAAKTKLASLCPVTPAEYNVASAHVEMLAHMSACMRELRDPALTLQQRMQVRAQMASMLRQALGAQRTLERMMAQRVKRDAVPAEAQAAAWAEHIAYSTMTRPFAQVFGEGDDGAVSSSSPGAPEAAQFRDSVPYPEAQGVDADLRQQDDVSDTGASMVRSVWTLPPTQTRTRRPRIPPMSRGTRRFTPSGRR
jgi:hypothetical protein